MLGTHLKGLQLDLFPSLENLKTFGWCSLWVNEYQVGSLF